jgi:hypothetical protein
LSSCSNQDSKVIEKPYFDLESLINNQIELLTRVNPLILKVWVSDNKTEKKETKISNWQKELEIFESSDINKKGLIKSYSITKNDTIEKYTLIEGEETPVKRFTVFKDSNNQLRNIVIESETNNFLFKSKSDLNLKFKNNLISEYAVSVSQKMFLSDGNSRKITGTILQ